MSYLDWHVGMKVVCVDDLADVLPPDSPALEVGRIYEIGEIECSPKGTITGVGPDWVERLDQDAVFIYTKELGPHEGYDAEAFRPVQTRKTDISIFQQLLVSPKVKIGADA